MEEEAPRIRARHSDFFEEFIWSGTMLGRELIL